MNRVKENEKVNEEMAKVLKEPYIYNSGVYNHFILAILCDISKSLAVIADKLSKDDNRTCDGCRHNVFPDGDAECCTCSNYYGNKYESREE